MIISCFSRLHTLIFSFISSGVSFILYGVLHIVVIRIVQQPFLLINHLTLTPVLLLYLIHISKLLFDLQYPGSLTASNLTLGGSSTRSSTLCIWMTTLLYMVCCVFQATNLVNNYRPRKSARTFVSRREASNKLYTVL